MVFTVEVEMYEGSWDDGRFSFEAEDEKDALEKAQSWGRYHSYSPSMIRVREATENEAANWLHNEYIKLTN